MGREVKRVRMDFVFPLVVCSYFEAASEQHAMTCENCRLGKVRPGNICPDFQRDPPTGDGWQYWSTTIDAPLTPVFSTAEKMVEYLADSPRYERRFSQEEADGMIAHLLGKQDEKWHAP